jgi:hypothetical protein
VLHSIGKHTVHSFQVGELGSHIHEMPGGDVADLGTRLMPAMVRWPIDD